MKFIVLVPIISASYRFRTWDKSIMQTKKNDKDAPSTRARKGRAVVVGLGLDDDGGHVRYTRGDAFELIGGSESSHREMQTRALRIKDEISRLGISLESMTREQYDQIQRVIDRFNSEPSGR